MIGKLTGKLLEKAPPSLLLEVSGVGYEIEAPMTTFVALPDLSAEVSLFTHLSIRENAHSLYGFANRTDRDLFRTLIAVSGIGPKVALVILSGMTAVEFSQYVATENVGMLEALPGIGRKTAARLLVEVRGRLPAQQEKIAPSLTSKLVVKEQAKSALVALGYKNKQATQAVEIAFNDDMTVETVIMAALQQMTK